MSKSPRRLAAEVLCEVEKQKAYSNIAFDKSVREEKLSGSDSAFASALVYGVLERKLTLDYCLSKFSSRELSELDDTVHTILRLGAYQIMFMDSVPQRAAVSESVILANELKCFSAKGYINAVLRRLAENYDKIEYPDREKKFYSYLSAVYSAPKWLVKKLCGDYGNDTAERILKNSLSTPPVYIRVNTLKTSSEELIKLLESKGVKCTLTKLDNCIKIEHFGALKNIEEFKKGYFYVQDMASQLCALAVGAKEGMSVLDVCAAPGSKSFTTAMYMSDKGSITSCDIHEHRVKLIEATAQKLNISCIQAKCADACVYDKDRQLYDIVLCDVPCSGFGVIRRKPEIKYKEKGFYRELSDVQKKILDTSSRYVKPGGRIIYSTCTLNKGENEDIVYSFLEKNNNFEIEKLPKILYDYGQGEKEVTLIPDPDGPDGFFICAMRKKFD